MRRLLPLLFGGCLALVAFTVSAADDTPPHPVPPGMADAACSHCHESPHEETADRFGKCATCHATEVWSPPIFGLAEHALLDFPLEGKHIEANCSSCHMEAKLTGMPTECAGCHIDRHRGLLGESCTDCHAVSGFKPVADFDHGKSGFALAGTHASTDCATCHTGDNGQKLREGKGGACVTCHTPGHGDLGEACETCHAPDGPSFASVRGNKVFDHRTTGFPLERKHSAQKCGACHVQNKPAPDTRCTSCHVSPHGGQLGGQCQDCHEPDRWSLARFDHDLAGWTLRGAHFTASCTSCHTNQRWIGLTTACWDCHALDAARAPTRVDAHRFGRSDCSDCHSAWSWGF